MSTPLVEIFEIGEVGTDYVRFIGANTETRVTFADDEIGTKEENAGFFRGLQGKPAAIASDASFIGVDFWPQADGSLKVIPFPFPIASVQKLPGCLENRAEWECVGSNVEKIRPGYGWVLCGHTVYNPTTWEPKLVLCDTCCKKRGYRW
jgi:hypothetical protein